MIGRSYRGRDDYAEESLISGCAVQRFSLECFGVLGVCRNQPSIADADGRCDPSPELIGSRWYWFHRGGSSEEPTLSEYQGADSFCEMEPSTTRSACLHLFWAK